MNYLLDMAQLCNIAIILAVSLNLINGMCGQFSLGHAGFWAIGAYTGASFSTILAPEMPAHLIFLISIVLSFVSASIAGLLIGIPCLRLRGDYLAIATLGLGEIIRIIIMNTDVLGGPRGLTGIPKLSNLPWSIVLAIVTIVVCVNVKRSTHGRAIIAIRENEIAAESMGVNILKYKTLAFVLGAGFAGVAGTLLAHTNQFIGPSNFTFMASVTILLMVILGGSGSITGAVVGAIILTLLPETLKFLGQKVSEWRMVLYAVLLIFLMLARPSGLLGNRELNLSYWCAKLINLKFWRKA